MASNEFLNYSHIIGSRDVYLLSVRLPNYENQSQKTRITFICDCSASMGDTYSKILVPSIKRYYEQVKCIDCMVFLFGETVTKYRIEQASDFRLVESKSLEGRTDIQGGITSAVDEAIEYYCKAEDKNYTQIFFFASDGAHNVTTQDKLELAISECGEKIKNQGVSSLFLVVGIGASSSTSCGMKAKQAIQTITATGELPIHYARTHSDLSETMKELMEEQSVALGILVHLSCTATEETGLLNNLISKPVPTLSKMENGPSLFCLYRGNPSKNNFLLLVKSQEIPLTPKEQIFTESYPLVQILQQTIQHIAILGVTQDNTEAIRWKTSLLSLIQKIPCSEKIS